MSAWTHLWRKRDGRVVCIRCGVAYPPPGRSGPCRGVQRDTNE